VQFILFRDIATAAILHTVGGVASSPGVPPEARDVEAEAAAATTARSYFLAAGWSWVGTWITAGALATLAGALGAQSRRRALRQSVVDTAVVTTPDRPLTPSAAE
jgi:hypothetical protein